jgi:Transglutaminase-like superfamily
MARALRFFGLVAHDRRLLISALVTLAMLQVAVQILSLRAVLGLVSRLTQARPQVALASREATPTLRSALSRVRWAVAAASRLLPLRTACLGQALATHVMLRRRGHASLFRIGVFRAPGGRLEAHAWVEIPESCGRDSMPSSHFTPLLEQGPGVA